MTCRALGVSRLAFAAWDQKPGSDRDPNDAYLTNAAIDVYVDDPEFARHDLAA